MKKKLGLIIAGTFSLLLPSCSKILTGMNNYYITDYFVLSEPVATFSNSSGETVSSFNPSTDKGNVNISISYGSLYVHEDNEWTAAAHLAFGVQNEFLNFDDRIENCASNEYQAKTTDKGWNRYKYDLKECELFGDAISFSDFQKKYELIIFTFEIYAFFKKRLWVVTSFRSFVSITYSGESISKIDFGKISLDYSRDNYLQEVNSSSFL